MSESLPKPEEEKPVSREEAMAAYRPFIEAGITSPDQLDLNDPAVQAANNLFYSWQKQADSRAGGDEEQFLRANLAKTMFYVDAGFTDQDYLDEVLKDWLAQNADNMKKEEDNPERAETRRQMAAAMQKIRGLLKK